jgi:hypothetical protein
MNLAAQAFLLLAAQDLRADLPATAQQLLIRSRTARSRATRTRSLIAARNSP